MIRFVFKPRKLVSAEQIGSLLFFADKQHLLIYGRQITGDRYCALGYGPAPALCIGNAEPIAALEFKPLSNSDLKVLNEIVATYAYLPAWMV